MKIHVLPGIKQKTEAWAYKLLKELVTGDSTATVQRYLHWDSGEDSCLKSGDELERLKGCDMDLLIGKSLGVMLGLQACNKGIVSPKKAIFIGTPVTAFPEESLDLRQLTSDLAIPVLYIQQKDDIVGSATGLREHLTADVELIEIPGNNHQYKDIKLLARNINKWLGSS